MHSGRARSHCRASRLWNRRPPSQGTSPTIWAASALPFFRFSHFAGGRPGRNGWRPALQSACSPAVRAPSRCGLHLAGRSRGRRPAHKRLVVVRMVRRNCVGNLDWIRGAPPLRHVPTARSVGPLRANRVPPISPLGARGGVLGLIGLRDRRSIRRILGPPDLVSQLGHSRWMLRNCRARDDLAGVLRTRRLRAQNRRLAGRGMSTPTSIAGIRFQPHRVARDSDRLKRTRMAPDTTAGDSRRLRRDATVVNRRKSQSTEA